MNRGFGYKRFEDIVPDHILNYIIATRIPKKETKDSIIWGLSKAAKFTVKSTYNWLISKHLQVCFPQFLSRSCEIYHVFPESDLLLVTLHDKVANVRNLFRQNIIPQPLCKLIMWRN